MTGRELIEWIKANKAEGMQVVQIEDGYAVFRSRPEVREADEIKRIYVNSAGMRKGEKVIVL